MTGTHTRARTDPCSDPSRLPVRTKLHKYAIRAPPPQAYSSPPCSSDTALQGPVGVQVAAHSREALRTSGGRSTLTPGDTPSWAEPPSLGHSWQGAVGWAELCLDSPQILLVLGPAACPWMGPQVPPPQHPMCPCLRLGGDRLCQSVGAVSGKAPHIHAGRSP